MDIIQVTLKYNDSFYTKKYLVETLVYRKDQIG